LAETNAPAKVATEKKFYNSDGGRISDKVVGILRRAKKYRLVYFEPEMLFQGNAYPAARHFVDRRLVAVPARLLVNNQV
jgi:Costars